LTRFCCHFLLNETTRFVQNGVVSYNVHKKNKEKAPNGAVLNGTVAFLLPWTHQAGEEKDFSFLLCPFPLSPKPPKRGDAPLGWFCGAAAQWSPLPLSPLFYL